MQRFQLLVEPSFAKEVLIPAANREFNGHHRDRMASESGRMDGVNGSCLTRCDVLVER